MAPRWQLKDRTLDLRSPVGVGIVNVTSDSMYEGARSETPEQAVTDGLALAEAGEEAARLAPAIEGLAERTEVPISADTFSAGVARRALDAGAVAINDIS